MAAYTASMLAIRLSVFSRPQAALLLTGSMPSGSRVRGALSPMRWYSFGPVALGISPPPRINLSSRVSLWLESRFASSSSLSTVRIVVAFQSVPNSRL